MAIIHVFSVTLASGALLTACVTASKAQANFTGIDAFGSPRIEVQTIEAKHGQEIATLSELNEMTESFHRLKGEIEKAVKVEFGLAAAEISVVTYPPKNDRYLTFDLLEIPDVNERTPFSKPPSGEYQDPNGALAVWDEYWNLSFELLRSGEFQGSKMCPIWHCFLGFEHPKLAPYLARLNSLTEKNQTKLLQILTDDAKTQRRASAAFLLAHISDGDAVIQAMQPAIFDSEMEVRNNALRVLVLISINHPEKRIPLDPVTKALRFPTTLDRNKAGSVLAILSKRPENRAAILKADGWVLFDMLKLMQPNNHDPAYTTLKNLSGEKFGDRDYIAWETWLKARIGPRRN